MCLTETCLIAKLLIANVTKHFLKDHVKDFMQLITIMRVTLIKKNTPREFNIPGKSWKGYINSLVIVDIFTYRHV